MNATKLVLIAMAVIITVVTISYTIIVTTTGDSMFKQEIAISNDVLNDIQKEYTNLDDKIVSGAELKITIRSTYDDLYWKVLTNVSKQSAMNNDVSLDDLYLEGKENINMMMDSVNQAEDNYIADDGEFVLELVDVSRDVKELDYDNDGIIDEILPIIIARQV